MFKRGQVVRGRETGHLFLIEGSGSIGSVLYDLNLLAAKQLPCGTLHLVRFNSCELIGNNYQPKDMNKELREVRT